MPIAEHDLIAGLGRGLAVIEAFDDEFASMSATEVAHRTGLSRTAARRYLLTLAHFGYATADARRFRLTPRVLRLGQSYLLSARLPRLAQSFLERLAAETGAAASLAVLDGHDVIYLSRSGGLRMPSAVFQLGARVPAHVVSPGIAMLAALEPPALRLWLRGHVFRTYTRFTMTRRADLKAEVDAARERGYALLSGQLELGWYGLAVALRDRRGDCVGALSLTAATLQLDPQRLTDTGLPALRAAESALRGLL